MMTGGINRPTRMRLRHGGDAFDVVMTYGASTHLTISVHPDLRVTANVPRVSDPDRVRIRIQARAGWICRQRLLFRQSRPLPIKRAYISGETHLFLGRQYRLRIRVSGTETVVKLRGGYLHVEARHSLGTAEVREFVENWYRSKARELLTKKCEQWHERLIALNLPKLRPRLRAMKTRWGSCTTVGTILLNPDLVKMPVQCIDYVIVHELCHLRILRHSPEFYRLMSRYLPDWKARKERLDRIRLPKA